MRWVMVGAALVLAGCVAAGLPPEQQRIAACGRQGQAYQWQTQRCVPGPAGSLVDGTASPTAVSGPDLSLPHWDGQVVEPGSPEAAALDGLVTGRHVDLPWAAAGSGP